MSALAVSEEKLQNETVEALEFDLSSKQQAVYDALQAFADASVPRSKFVLSGLAGTGKTTVITRFIESLHRQGFRVGLAAPTGKAARVLNSKQKAVKACTLHRLFGVTPITLSEEQKLEFDRLTFKHLNEKHLNVEEQARFFELQKIVDRAKKKVSFADAKADEVNANYDIVVIDEASMLGKRTHAQDLGLNLLSIPVIFVGDPGQLPPVKDECCVNWDKPNAHLSEILRQTNGSGIVPYSHAIYQGAWPKRDVVEMIPNIKLIPNMSPRVISAAENGHQVLVQKNATRHQFNWMLRQKRGVKGEIYDHYPAIGETIMCNKNYYPRGLFNGSMIEVTRVTTCGQHPRNKFLCDIEGIDDDGILRTGITVSLHDMCETLSLYPSHIDNQANLEHAKNNGIEFRWTYAMTVHKSQGSEWDNVILIGEMSPHRDEGRKWWYTGVTRAKRELIIATTEIE
jgi:exodeoxyribonuclease-5